MATYVSFFVLGLAAAWVGAELFVRSASSLALRLGISPLVIGLTIVAWGTSSPELAVSLRAASQGQGGVALGNVVGSNIFNVGVILGLAACIRPLQVQLSLLRLDVPILVGLTLVFAVLFVSDSLTSVGGGILLAGFIVYSVLTFVYARADVPPAVSAEFSREQPRSDRALWVALVGLAGGLTLLVYGGGLMVDQAVVLARATGLSERVIGLTIVAAGTSCPELLASIVAAYRGSADIAVGNIIGSNIFNVAAILGCSSLMAPIDSGGLASLDLVALMASSLVLLPVMRTDFTIVRWEGVMLIVGYVVYTLLLFT